MATLTFDDVIAALRLLETGIDGPQRDGVRRILDTWRLAGRSKTVPIDDADLGLLRALAAHHALDQSTSGRG